MQQAAHERADEHIAIRELHLARAGHMAVLELNLKRCQKEHAFQYKRAGQKQAFVTFSKACILVQTTGY